MPNSDVLSAEKSAVASLMATYNRFKVTFVRGKGARLYDTEEREYTDFGSGIAVTAFGHADPILAETLKRQADTLWHVSNLYYTEPQLRLAKRLTDNSFADRVFFGNSGTEAMECAFKAARRYHFVKGAPERRKIITFKGAFHGRTLLSMAAAGTVTADGFGTISEDHVILPFGDHEALKKAITSETAAIAIEPILGEGGIKIVPDECLRGLRTLCDENGVLLIFDEIQSGSGRTGKLFAFEHAGVTPDICAIAKGIGGGFPLGACLTTEAAACGLTYGTHGSTYGGNPLACAVGDKCLERLTAPGFLDAVKTRGDKLRDALKMLKIDFSSLITEIRGRGLLAGVKFCDAITARDFAEIALQEKLVIIPASDNVIRVMPPLNIPDEDMAAGLAALRKSCEIAQIKMK